MTLTPATAAVTISSRSTCVDLPVAIDSGGERLNAGALEFGQQGTAYGPGGPGVLDEFARLGRPESGGKGDGQPLQEAVADGDAALVDTIRSEPTR